MLESITPLLSDPAAWAALVTLVVMEVVLGIDNLIFISILSNKLPPEHRQRTRRIGIGLALIMRLGLLAAIGWIVGLTAPVFDLGIHGESFDTAFSWRDLILIADGFGVHVPKGYIYAAMAFSALVEGLNMWSRNAQIKKDQAKEAAQAALNKAETAEPGV